MVVNPETLLAEIDMLRSYGIRVDETRLRLSHAAHLITPAHRALDKAQEKPRGSGLIGTTGRGIGPAYTDKAARSGLRLEDMLDQNTFYEKLVEHVTRLNRSLTLLYGAAALDPEAVAEQYLGYARTAGALHRRYFAAGLRSAPPRQSACWPKARRAPCSTWITAPIPL